MKTIGTLTSGNNRLQHYQEKVIVSQSAVVSFEIINKTDAAMEHIIYGTSCSFNIIASPV